MKKVILSIAIVLSIASIFAFKPSINNTATVNQEQGVYLFVESTPVSEFIYLGDVKNSVRFSNGSGQFSDVKKKLLKACKKEYPQANGLIFHLVDGGVDHADAILFK